MNFPPQAHNYCCVLENLTFTTSRSQHSKLTCQNNSTTKKGKEKNLIDSTTATKLAIIVVIIIIMQIRNVAIVAVGLTFTLIK